MDASNTPERPTVLASIGRRLVARGIDCAIAVLIFFIVKFSAARAVKQLENAFQLRKMPPLFKTRYFSGTNSYMRVFAVFLAACLMAGCASKPDYYISPAPVTIPKTATYWLDTFDVEVVGKNERFLPDDKVRQQLGVDLVDRLLKAKRYAASKDKADYLLDVNVIYTRRIQDTQGGFMTAIVDDKTILASVDFNYQVKVKKAGAEVLHFSQARQGLMPGGYKGDWQNMKTMAGVLTNSGNSSVETFYTGLLSRFIVDDLRGIPSR